MIQKEFWGLLFLGFIAWVFVASNPQERIEHFCRPIGWGGNVVTSLTAMATPDHQGTIQQWFNKFEYGCRYTTWRLFYQKDFNEWQKQQDEANARTREAERLLESPSPQSEPASQPAQGAAQ